MTSSNGVTFLKEKLAKLPSMSVTKRKVIRKAPKMLRYRENLIKYFEPRGVSIGPIHHLDTRLQLAEELKYKLAKDFIDDSGCKIEQLYELVELNIKNLIECYAAEDIKGIKHEELPQIFLVDGCALLHFILHVAHPPSLKTLNINYDLIAFAQQDVFLLENQLPFRLLELLMSHNKNESILHESIHRFVRMNAMVVMPHDKYEVPKSQPLHLLDLLRMTLLFGCRINHTPSVSYYMSLIVFSRELRKK